MKIEITDLKFYKTVDGLGGAITPVEVPATELHNVFGKVEANEALLGSTKYQCIYFKNTHASLALLDTLFYQDRTTPSTDTNIFIGLGTSGVGGTEQAIADIDTAPLGVTFTAVQDESIDVGNVPATSHFAIWLKRVVEPNAEAYSYDGFSLLLQGKTEASV